MRLPVCKTTDDMIYKAVCPTTNNMTYENIYFIACLKLDIWEAIY